MNTQNVRPMTAVHLNFLSSNSSRCYISDFSDCGWSTTDDLKKAYSFSDRELTGLVLSLLEPIHSDDPILSFEIIPLLDVPSIKQLIPHKNSLEGKQLRADYIRRWGIAPGSK